MARAREKEVDAVEVDEITLDGKRITVRNQSLTLERVRLDPTNPRIAHTFAFERGGDARSEEKQLEDRLWSDPDVRDLLRQVEINKGLIERIIVRSDYSVVEGNCRTVVFRKLRERYPKDPAWQKIPARVLPSDIGGRDVAILLGEMHVAGKNTWSPFEKAGHTYRLHKEFMLTQDEIASRLRISKSKVNQLIRAFEAMRLRYLPQYPGRGAIRKFSYFEELFKNSELRDWAVDSKNLDKFVEWVGEGRIDQGAQVRALPAILENKAAHKAFLESGFAAAKKIVEADNPALTSPLFKAMVELTGLLEQARMDDIMRLRKGSNDSARHITENLSIALSRFRELSGLE
jgi:hypothetical protein